MPILGCAILPHSQMVLDPTLPNCPEGILEVHEGCKAVGEVVAAWEPELIVFLTPHGISAPRSPRPGIYLTPSATGKIDQGDESGNAAGSAKPEDAIVYELAIQIDNDLATGFLNHLGSQGIACVKITGTEAPLGPSELIPLWFLRRVAMLPFAPKYLLLSLPGPVGGTSLHRSPSSQDRVPDMLSYGNHLWKYLSWVNKKVAVVASADLSHTHATRCRDKRFLPDPEWGMPVSDAAAVFDGIVEKWVSTLTADFLLRDAAALVRSAISCGFDAFVVLQALIEKEGKHRFSSHIFARHRPTYVGLIAAVMQVDKRVPNPEFTYRPPGVVDE
ncbi:uncharacterized protein EV422DRAFT_541786 [Fimicolochytrium jonesii]|uniref:uncharacterized protein n=1 Tax=Fimicolochytrium jonesii TaxID=1396493 RepID=UPI0022FE473D|nr:uncharacterized protein EV422DRAFT_541786 [Fimicolochytrium jonesii]KAI8817436.1 hypothetical protein EV422DRAFT_541786 [Fimicolochytrium jonesii]